MWYGKSRRDTALQVVLSSVTVGGFEDEILVKALCNARYHNAALSLSPCDTGNRQHVTEHGSNSKTESVRHDPRGEHGEVRRREAGKHQGIKARAAAGGG